MDYKRLYDIVQSNYVGQTPEQIAADMATVVKVGRKDAEVASLFNILVKNGEYPKIVDAAANATDVNLRGAAITALALKDTMSDVPMIDLDHPTAQAFLNLFLVNGVITQATYDEIMALGDDMRTKAEATYGLMRPPSPEDIRFALQRYGGVP